MNKIAVYIYGASGYILTIVLGMALLLLSGENPSAGTTLAALSVLVLVVTFFFSLVLFLCVS